MLSADSSAPFILGYPCPCTCVCVLSSAHQYPIWFFVLSQLPSVPASLSLGPGKVESPECRQLSRAEPEEELCEGRHALSPDLEGPVPS